MSTLLPWHSIHIERFTPGEVERITGVAPVALRDLRRRGHLPENPSGWSRFDPFTLTQIWVLRLLGDRGVGPQAAKDVTEKLARSILVTAFMRTQAYAGDFAKALTWLPPETLAELKTPNPEMMERVRAYLAAQGVGDDVVGPAILAKVTAPLWRHQSIWLQSQVWKVLKGVNLPDTIAGIESLASKATSATSGTYFVWFPDNTYASVSSLDDAFDAMLPSNPKLAGALVVFDISALATVLLERVGGPLVHVRFYDGDRPEKPLDAGELSVLRNPELITHGRVPQELTTPAV